MASNLYVSRCILYTFHDQYNQKSFGFVIKIKQGDAKMTVASILVGKYDICSGKRQKTK